MAELVLETRDQDNRTPQIGPFLLTPSLGGNYWSYRVVLTATQAILGFPKFDTIGIGFAREDEDWNTNLPYTCDAQTIYDHIEHNKGDDSISAEDCVAAIEMIRTAVYATPEHAEKMRKQGRPIDWVNLPITFEAVDLGAPDEDDEPTAEELRELIADCRKRIALYLDDDSYSVGRRVEIKGEIAAAEVQLANVESAKGER